jgi:hypothetical protein
MVPDRDHQGGCNGHHKNRISGACKPKILRPRDGKWQPELIGGWHIALKKDTQGRCDWWFVIAGLNLPVLTRHASLQMLYRKPRRDPKENWKNHG